MEVNLMVKNYNKQNNKIAATFWSYLKKCAAIGSMKNILLPPFAENSNYTMKKLPQRSNSREIIVVIFFIRRNSKYFVISLTYNRNR